MRHVWLPVMIVAALCGVVVLAGMSHDEQARPAIPRPPEPRSGIDAWADAEALQAQFAWACEAVHLTCGKAYRLRPTVAMCTRETCDRPYASAWFDREQNTVLVNPDTVAEQIRRIRSECSTRSLWLLRLLLVHEATHALDDQHYDHFGAKMVPPGDALRWDVCVMKEGHAEYVTAKVADALDVADEHRAYLALLHGVPCWQTLERHLAGHENFKYTEGLRILRRAEALGGRELVERVLSQPPPYLGGPDWEDEFLQTRLAEIRR